ncbi:MAG: phosphate ABC transporter substrate-binding protein [Magnetococcales bacterium]|nr:phosphate ABC transporter substrate-binding protein [Magnetococcales bacterium]NGZ25522.1 phosphate ABC transporter substrate-binding protein [Magnetococcales bacterium]
MRQLLIFLSVVVLLGSVALVQAALPSQMIRNKGSDTMYKVATTWAEAYVQRNKNLDKKRQETLQGSLRGNYVPLEKVEIHVTGGGSGNGIASLINGHSDIANSSRAVKEKEINLAIQMGQPKPMGFIVGWDAVVILVHDKNPMEGIEVDQLRNIFEKIGHVTHWKQLDTEFAACESNQIKRISRKNTSGTYAFFKNRIGSDNVQFNSEMDSLEYSREVVNHTANTPCAIAYAGMAYITDGVKVLCIKDAANTPCVYPSVQSVADRTYPFARPLYMYTLGHPEGPVKDYLDWVRGAEGQKILKDAGYVPLKDGPSFD